MHEIYYFYMAFSNISYHIICFADTDRSRFFLTVQTTVLLIVIVGVAV